MRPLCGPWGIRDRRRMLKGSCSRIGCFRLCVPEVHSSPGQGHCCWKVCRPGSGSFSWCGKGTRCHLQVLGWMNGRLPQCPGCFGCFSGFHTAPLGFACLVGSPDRSSSSSSKAVQGHLGCLLWFSQSSLRRLGQPVIGEAWMTFWMPGVMGLSPVCFMLIEKEGCCRWQTCHSWSRSVAYP